MIFVFRQCACVLAKFIRTALGYKYIGGSTLQKIYK